MLARATNPAEPNTAGVSRPSDALASRLLVTDSVTSLLLGLGAIALLVGGVGIANVVVISVLERRTEIGPRRALGAARRHIAVQFLTGSLLLSALGGAAGAALGAAATHAVATSPRLADRGRAVPGRLGRASQPHRRPPYIVIAGTHAIDETGSSPPSRSRTARRRQPQLGRPPAAATSAARAAQSRGKPGDLHFPGEVALNDDRREASMIKRIAALGVLTTAIVGAALVPAGPASAHNLTLTLEAGGIRTTGTLTQTHTWVTNCDNMADGHGTRTRYILSNGREEYVGDPDGQGGSCGAERAPMTVISMQVCFKAIGPNEQCNPWRAA